MSASDRVTYVDGEGWSCTLVAWGGSVGAFVAATVSRPDGTVCLLSSDAGLPCTTRREARRLLRQVKRCDVGGAS